MLSSSKSKELVKAVQSLMKQKKQKIIEIKLENTSDATKQILLDDLKKSLKNNELKNSILDG
jgi:hypothetical protein